MMHPGALSLSVRQRQRGEHVNLKTAEAMGITLPETIFFCATEVIE